MNALLHFTSVSLKLNFRNRMAILYGYLFPLIFLVAFWTVYRNDPVPLALHVGQFLTVTVLGSACFGLPTTIVSERERGLWRRYALAPVARWTFVHVEMCQCIAVDNLRIPQHFQRVLQFVPN